MSEKSHDPTPARLRKAREDGDSGASTVAAQAVGFFVAVTVAPAAIAALATASESSLRAAIGRAGDRVAPAGDAASIATAVLTLALPMLAATGVAAGAAQLVQTGGVIATRKLAPKLDRLNVLSGLATLVTTERLASVLRSLAGCALVTWLAYRAVRLHAADLARVAGNVGAAGVVAGRLARELSFDAALAGLGLGVVDRLVVRRAWWKKLKMSPDEVKREHRESEGDPQNKAARERARHEMVASANVANVKNATVVIVNPTHLACALRYAAEDGDDAPVMVASGEGDLARRIVEAARAYGVPVLRDVPLARALIELEAGEAIPEALYEAVAAILQEAWAESDSP